MRLSMVTGRLSPRLDLNLPPLMTDRQSQSFANTPQ
jgi:hypothetical protein